MAKLALFIIMTTSDNTTKKNMTGYTILPDGTRHEFVIEGWEEYIRDEDTPAPIPFFDCEKSSN